MKILLIEKKSLLNDFIKRSLVEQEITVFSCSNEEEALRKMSYFEPDIVMCHEEVGGERLLNFCKEVREKYSLLLPIVLVINFYSSMDLSAFRNLGVEILVSPFGEEEFRKMISLSIKPSKEEIQPKPSEEIEVLVEKLKPYLNEIVRQEVGNILREFMEVLERKNG